MRTEKKKLHYGWIVFAACFVMVFVTLGFCSSVKSLYLAPVTKDTGLPRSIFSLNDCCRYIVVAVLNIFFGRIVARVGARKMVIAGFLFLAISQYIFSVSSTALVFCIGGCFLGLGLAFSTTTIVGYFVEKWFTNSKGTIMGIILAANGLGASLASQVLSPIIESASDGWRNAYRTSAIIVLITGIIVILFLRNDPAEMNLEPMGKEKELKTAKGEHWLGYAYDMVKKKPYYLLTLLCCFLYGVIIQSYSSCSSAHFRDVGVDPVVIANVSSIYSLLLFAAKTGTGFLFDKAGLRTVVLFCSAFACISIFVMAGVTGNTGAYVYSLVAAFGLPLETIVMPLLAMDMFGVTPYARIMGIVVGMVQLGSCAGMLLTNAYFDRFGTYRPIMVFYGIVLIAVTVLMNVLITKAHKDRRKYK